MTASEERLVEVRAKYGRTIHEILAKENQHDLYKTLGAIEILVESKIVKKLPITESERMLFAFVCFAREVRNGGLSQFFLNSTGDCWKDVLWGLEVLSDKDGLAAYKRALSIFPNSTPSLDSYERFDQLNKSEVINLAAFKDCVARADKFDGLTVIQLPQSGDNEEAKSRDEWNARVDEHWNKLTPEYYRKPYPDWNLVYEYVKSHAADFDLEKA